MTDQAPITEAEEWRSVVGYEGWYSVSSLGRVRRERGGRGARIGHILSPGRSSNGYLSVLLCAGGLDLSHLVQHLVCAAFHGLKPSALHEAAHWDRDRANNRADNLRWATPAENTDDKLRHGTVPRGSDHANARLSASDVLAIRRRRLSGEMTADVAASYGVAASTISKITRGRRWVHLDAEVRP